MLAPLVLARDEIWVPLKNLYHGQDSNAALVDAQLLIRGAARIALIAVSYFMYSAAFRLGSAFFGSLAKSVRLPPTTIRGFGNIGGTLVWFGTLGLSWEQKSDEQTTTASTTTWLFIQGATQTYRNPKNVWGYVCLVGALVFNGQYFNEKYNPGKFLQKSISYLQERYAQKIVILFRYTQVKN